MRRVLESGEEVFVAIISHLRAGNVEAMTAQVGPATWYVGSGEGDEYGAHAAQVVEAGGLCPSRNAALDDGHRLGLPVVELSDDLRRLQFAPSKLRADLRPLTFDAAVQWMLDRSREYGAKLAGAAPTDNPFFLNPGKPVRQGNFIVGDFIVVQPCHQRFDERLMLKEDYDYTLQHVEGFGGVARCDNVLASFLHRGNAGGACAFRTSEREQDAIRFLKAKWPGLLHDHPSRADEVVLRLR